MKTVITAATLFNPLEVIDSPIILIEDGRVVSINSRSETQIPAGGKHFDFPQMIIAPGFIDVHVHGNAGHDVMETDDSALNAVGSAMAKHGVTSFLPTTVTAPEDRLLHSLELLGKNISRNNGRRGSRPVGIHLEGPFISHAKR